MDQIIFNTEHKVINMAWQNEIRKQRTDEEKLRKYEESFKELTDKFREYLRITDSDKKDEYKNHVDDINIELFNFTRDKLGE